MPANFAVDLPIETVMLILAGLLVLSVVASKMLTVLASLLVLGHRDAGRVRRYRRFYLIIRRLFGGGVRPWPSSFPAVWTRPGRKRAKLKESGR